MENPLELLDRAAVCRFFGGLNALNTLSRHPPRTLPEACKSWSRL